MTPNGAPGSRPMTPNGGPRFNGPPPMSAAGSPRLRSQPSAAPPSRPMSPSSAPYNQTPRPLSPGPIVGSPRAPRPQQPRSMSPGPYGGGKPPGKIVAANQRKRSSSTGAVDVRERRNSPPGPSPLGGIAAAGPGWPPPRRPVGAASPATQAYRLKHYVHRTAFIQRPFGHILELCDFSSYDFLMGGDMTGDRGVSHQLRSSLCTYSELLYYVRCNKQLPFKDKTQESVRRWPN